MKMFKSFIEKMRTKESAKHDVGAIKQTLEFSSRDFPFLSIQFLVSGISFLVLNFLNRQIQSYIGDNNWFDALMPYILWLILIPQFVFYIKERARLKNLGIYTFQLYDAWGSVWFLVGIVNCLICGTFELLSLFEVVSRGIAMSVLVISQLFDILLLSVMLTVTGFVLENNLFKFVSIWLLLISPFIIIGNLSEEAFTKADKLVYALDYLKIGIDEIKSIICIFYIVIGLCYIGKRKAVTNGTC